MNILGCLLIIFREILRDLEERIKGKEEIVKDVKMLENDQRLIIDQVVQENMDLTDENNPNDVIVSSGESLSVEEKRASSYDSLSEENLNNSVSTQHTSDSDENISNVEIEANCDSKNNSEDSCDIGDSGLSDKASSNNSDNTSVNIGEENLGQSLCDTNNEQSEENFNAFLFWRAPLPEVDLTLEKENRSLDENKLTVYARDFEVKDLSSDCIVSPELAENENDVDSQNRQIMTADVCTLQEFTETVDNIGSTNVISDHLKELSLSSEMHGKCIC